MLTVLYLLVLLKNNKSQQLLVISLEKCLPRATE